MDIGGKTEVWGCEQIPQYHVLLPKEEHGLTALPVACFKDRLKCSCRAWPSICRGMFLYTKHNTVQLSRDLSAPASIGAGRSNYRLH